MRHAWGFVLLLVGCGAPAPFAPGDDLPPDTDLGTGDTDAVVDTDDVVDTDAVPADTDPPADCEALAAAGHEVCEERAHACDVVFDDASSCDAACAAAGLTCAAALENQDEACAPDLRRPPVSCASSHQSDFCVCVDAFCAPSCGARVCGGDGCGGSCGDCDEGTVCSALGVCESGPDACALGLCGLLPRCDASGCAAFPGAEGEGRFAEGGRGGDVYHVTTLNDTGPGSFREAVSGSGARVVVFDVGGIIDLNSTVRSSRNQLTIAGQTAPGEGITFRDWGVELTGDDLVVRHVHFRAGDREKKTASRTNGFTEDSFTLGGRDVIVDHVSASWGIDESLSGNSGEFDRVTVQWSIVSEGLRKSGLFHGEVDPDHDGHSMGSLMKSTAAASEVSLHHNLYVSNGNRNPAIGTYEDDQAMDADIRNNVIYNCKAQGYVSGVSQRIRVNYVGNYGIRGPDGDDRTLFDGNDESNVEIWQADNRLDRDLDGRFDGTVGGWDLFGDTYSKRGSVLTMEPVTTQSATIALGLVLDDAGAFPWDRDAVDERLVAEVRTAGSGGEIIDNTGEVGGQPAVNTGSPVVDTDRDGMPDTFELAYGTLPQVADGGDDPDGDGWTHLDLYLHWAASR